MEDKQQAFLQAISGHRGLIIKIAGMYTRTREEREDLTQEILYQLWKSYDGFEGRARFSTWMYRVAMNTAIYYLKIGNRRIPTVSLNTLEIDLGDKQGEDGEWKWEIFRQQVEQLTPLDKGILLLYLDDKPYTEIAEIVGISPGNVGTKLTRIREKLKQSITKNT